MCQLALGVILDLNWHCMKFEISSSSDDRVNQFEYRRIQNQETSNPRRIAGSVRYPKKTGKHYRLRNSGVVACVKPHTASHKQHPAIGVYLGWKSTT